MAGIQRLIETHDLKTTLWNNTVHKGDVKPCYIYNEHVDSFTFLIVSPNTQKIVHYIDEHVALLYDQDSMEVIGIRVEAFEKSFLPKYTKLAKAWRLSEQNKDLCDFGDLIIEVRKHETRVVEELSKITLNIVEKQGFELPIPAYA